MQQWLKAGFRAEGLSYEDWQALATITRFYEVKDLEALVPKFQISGG
ncbi:MAG TPA: hypothetical protein VHC90_01890 [Bryobacteraceae bacterium]|nr:hypothetical protein [Bryobacteraceae bacterium]